MRHLGLLTIAWLAAAAPAAASDTQPGDLPPNTVNAAKLAGLAGFVNTACDALRTDAARLRQAIEALKVDPSALEHDALLMRTHAYMDAYRRDVPASCARAEALFGQNGSVIPGIFERR